MVNAVASVESTPALEQIINATRQYEQYLVLAAYFPPIPPTSTPIAPSPDWTHPLGLVISDSR